MIFHLPRNRKVISYALAGILAPALTPAPALGEQAERAMEEILVTSRKRVENLMDVPDQITVFTSQKIEDAGIDNVVDASQLTPGVYFSGDWSPTVNTFTIRGISNNPNGDAPVAFVVDGVVYGNSFLISQDLFDIEQIEILKGPQGALYGKGSTAGAVSITTKRPTNDPELKVKLRAANGSDYRAMASYSGPLIEDKLLFRLSGSIRDFDGVIDNEFVDDPVDFREESSIRGRLLYLPTDNLTIDLRAGYFDADHSGTRWRAENVPVGLGIPTGGVIQEDFITQGSTTVEDYSLRVDYETDFATFTSITSDQSIEAPRSVDLDFTQLSIIEASIDPEDADIFTQELRITSNNNDARIRWIVGAFYQKQERFRTISAWLNTTGAPYDPADKNLVQILSNPDEQENEVTAYFGQVNIDLTDQLELSLGLRYDEDERTNEITGDNETFSDTQPKVTLSYQPNEQWTFYATYSEGFRSGGFNASDVFQDRFDQEELENYELGFKANLFGGRLDLSGAAYYMDFSNQQFFLFSTTDAVQSLVNAKSSEITGVELEFHAQITDRLTIDGGVNYIDSELKELGEFPAFDIPEEQINGNDLLFTPEYTFNLSGQYMIPIENRYGIDVIARADFIRYGRMYWGIDNVESESQEPYNLLNLRLSLEKDDWRISLYADNVNDKEYDTFCFIGRFIGNSMGINPCFDGNPRRYGIEVSMNF